MCRPATEKELVTLVRKAQSEGLALRVRGSAHSVYQAIYADESPPGNINVQLDLYNRILHWDTTRKRVTVQAGCHLGAHPRNPRSNRKNSLLWQLERRGWALPDLGGITHQTVAGFLSTGLGGEARPISMSEPLWWACGSLTGPASATTCSPIRTTLMTATKTRSMRPAFLWASWVSCPR